MDYKNTQSIAMDENLEQVENSESFLMEEGHKKDIKEYFIRCLHLILNRSGKAK